MSSKDHDRAFVEAVLDAFQAAGCYTDKEVDDAGGPSTSWMTEARRIRDGKQDAFNGKPRSDTLRRIDQAAKWVPGSARQLLYTGTLIDQDQARRLADRDTTETVSPQTETSFSEWLTRSESEMTGEEQEELWSQAEGVLEALKAQVLRNRQRGSHLGDT